MLLSRRQIEEMQSARVHLVKHKPISPEGLIRLQTIELLFELHNIELNYLKELKK